MRSGKCGSDQQHEHPVYAAADEEFYDALTRAVEDHFEALKQYVLQRLPPWVQSDLHEDIVQDALLTAWRLHKKASGKEWRDFDHFANWLFRTAANNLLKARELRPRYRGAADGLDNQRVLDRDQNRQHEVDQREIARERVGKVMDELPSKEQRFYLSYLDCDGDFQELARLLGKSEGAVRKQYQRLNKKLNKKLSGIIKNTS